MNSAEAATRLQTEEGSSRWTSTHTWLMIAAVLGMLIESYIYSVGSVATGWVAMPKVLTSLLLAWSPIWLIIGIAVAGPVSDRIGRKRTFYFTMSMYLIGVVIILLANTYWEILLALAILLSASGGEMNTIMAQVAEALPTKFRTSGYYTVINGINLGTVILGAVALMNIFGNKGLQKTTVAITLLVAVVALILARTRYPESLLWLQRAGKTARGNAEAQRYLGTSLEAALPAASHLEPDRGRNAAQTSLALKLGVVIAVAWTNTTGYGLLTLVVGPYYYPKDTGLIILFSGLGSVIGGIVLAGIGDRIGRRSALLWTDILTLAVTIVVVVSIGAWSHNLALFWVLIFGINFFAGMNYLVEDMLKVELWPTIRRGTLTSVARFVSVGLYIPIIFLTAHFGITTYMIFNTCVWVVGTVAALAWYLWGHETGKGRSADAASGEATAVAS